MSSTFNAIQGLDELKRKLAQLAPKVEKKVLRAAWRKAANTLRDAVRQKAPVKTGLLKKKVVSSNSRGNATTIRMKVRATAVSASARAKPTALHPSGFERVQDPNAKGSKGYPYAAAVEFGHGFPGTRTRLRGKSRLAYEQEYGKSDVPAHPFFRPAWEATKDKMLDRFKVEAGQGIEKVAQENI